MQELRQLRIEFASAEAFRAEFERNIVNGGVFVEGEEEFEPRDPVQVDIVLSYCGESLCLAGEVVSLIPASMAGIGGKPGIAVHLLDAAAALRAHFAGFLSEPEPEPEPEPERTTPAARQSAAPTAAPPRVQLQRRKAPRTEARVPARLETAEGRGVGGRTRNLSRTGVLISVEEEAIPVGHEVRLTLEHPTNARTLEVEGRVMRHVCSESGEVTALGVEFCLEGPEQEDTERFLDELRATEHSRRLGGIRGAVSDLGVKALLETFSRAAPRGTIVFRHEAYEASVSFEERRIRSARLGRLRGTKALRAMLKWKHGDFEFHATPDADETNMSVGQAPVEAVLRSLQDISETVLFDPASEAAPALDPQSRLGVTGSLASLDHSDTEAAVFELASVGLTIGKIVEIIPEPEARVHEAIRTLIGQGVIESH